MTFRVIFEKETPYEFDYQTRSKPHPFVLTHTDQMTTIELDTLDDLLDVAALAGGQLTLDAETDPPTLHLPHDLFF